jgi:hypothetical protein
MSSFDCNKSKEQFRSNLHRVSSFVELFMNDIGIHECCCPDSCTLDSCSPNSCSRYIFSPGTCFPVAIAPQTVVPLAPASQGHLPLPPKIVAPTVPASQGHLSLTTVAHRAPTPQGHLSPSDNCSPNARSLTSLVLELCFFVNKFKIFSKDLKIAQINKRLRLV